MTWHPIKRTELKRTSQRVITAAGDAKLIGFRIRLDGQPNSAEEMFLSLEYFEDFRKTIGIVPHTLAHFPYISGFSTPTNGRLR